MTPTLDYRSPMPSLRRTRSRRLTVLACLVTAVLIAGSCVRTISFALTPRISDGARTELVLSNGVIRATLSRRTRLEPSLLFDNWNPFGPADWIRVRATRTYYGEVAITCPVVLLAASVLLAWHLVRRVADRSR